MVGDERTGIINTNPFSVQTPEGLPADQATQLFVDDYNDFPAVQVPGHAFLLGPRGSGKSMIFRICQPDCQQRKLNKNLRDLAFFAVYVPVKETQIAVTELGRLKQQYADILINEHLMVTYVASRFFETLRKLQINDTEGTFHKALCLFADSHFVRRLIRLGYKTDINLSEETTSLEECIVKLSGICDDLFTDASTYFQKLAFSDEVTAYSGALCSYVNFLLPLLKHARSLPFMPIDAPIFLLIDDADNLTETQAMIVNTWVSARTTSDVSLKISTTLAYKTYRTVTNRTIDKPHDYSEVDISPVYTSQVKTKYVDRVRKIVQRRLTVFGIANVSPDEFFPTDSDQDARIHAIRDRVGDDWERGVGNRAYRKSDAQVRYTMPQYMKSLADKGASSTFRYCGFEQLAHISSGLIRFFLEPASQMYTRQQAANPDLPVIYISPEIQHTVVYEESRSLMFAEFDKIRREPRGIHEHSYQVRVKKLANLVKALGETFREKLLSDDSERRVISIAFSDEPDDEILDVLDFGVELGYFHMSAIGNKDGTGRTRMYILTRRLAPFFNLDPTGFAGYLFVKSQDIRAAMYDSNALKRKSRRRGTAYFEQQELPFFL